MWMGSNIVCRHHDLVGRSQWDVYLGRGHADLPIFCTKKDGTEMAGRDRVCNRGAWAATVWPEGTKEWHTIIRLESLGCSTQKRGPCLGCGERMMGELRKGKEL